MLPSSTSGQNPTNQFNLRSEWNVSKKLQFDASSYYVSALPALNVPQYLRLDTRLGWRPSQAIDLSIGGQNLLRPHHREFVPEALIQGSEVDRSFYGRITWQF